MRTYRSGGLVTLLALVTLGLPAASADAQQRERVPVDGTFAFDLMTSRVTSFAETKKGWTASRTVTGYLGGGISGVLSTTETVDQRYISATEFTFSFTSEQVCTCVVDGRSGVFTMQLRGDGTQDAFEGRWRLIGQASGELAGMKGDGTLTGSPVTSAGRYTGTLRVPQ